LGQFKDAEAMFQEISKDANSKSYQVAAAYLEGDVAFQNGEAALGKDKSEYLKKSIEVYKAAIAKYP
jgi:hypothetical protein